MVSLDLINNEKGYLNLIKEEREKIQNEYLADAEKIWRSERLESIEKDKQVRKLHNSYKAKDKFLENLEARMESCLEDIKYYKEKY